MTGYFLAAAIALTVIAGAVAPLSAENIVFPADAGVLDVRDFGARGDGVADDTAAINSALTAAGMGHRIVYLPNGDYLISDTLRWAKGEKNVVLQGQSRDGVTIRLKDKAAEYQDAAKPRAMIWTGRKPAQRFRNAIRNLTVNTGRGNPGAIGIQFNTSNQGGLWDVRIIDPDGTARTGLDMAYTPEIGPLLARDVSIEGFDVGIRIDEPVNSMTFERLTLADQRTCGISVNRQVVSIRGLKSRGSVPVIQAGPHPDTVLVLLDAELVGKSQTADGPAIINEAKLYARNVHVAGYGQTIANRVGNKKDVTGDLPGEYVSHDALHLFDTETHSLNLPVKETPPVPWDDPSQWANVMAFGAKGDSAWPGTDAHTDDTEAVQRAIDSGRPTVYFPGGHTYRIIGTVHIRGGVRRIIGTEAAITGKGTFIFEDGSAPVVILERLAILGRGHSIIHNASRTLVISSSYVCRIVGKGNGDLFLDDVSNHWQHPNTAVESFLRMENAAQSVWCRQINPETSTAAKIINRGGTLWILGLKTEGHNVVIETTDGGRTEVLAAHVYALKDPKTTPCLVIDNASASFAGFRQWTFKPNQLYTDFVAETRDGETRSLRLEQSADGILPLYVGVANATDQTRERPK